MSILRLPDHLTRPLFAYGLLKPGELAFSLAAAGTWGRSLELLVTHRLRLAALPGTRRHA